MRLAGVVNDGEPIAGRATEVAVLDRPRKRGARAGITNSALLDLLLDERAGSDGHPAARRGLTPAVASVTTLPSATWTAPRVAATARVRDHRAGHGVVDRAAAAARQRRSGRACCCAALVGRPRQKHAGSRGAGRATITRAEPSAALWQPPGADPLIIRRNEGCHSGRGRCGAGGRRTARAARGQRKSAGPGRHRPAARCADE